MIDLLLLPLQLDFMRDAMLVAVLVSVPTALLSCLLVLRGWALMGDAIAHAVLPGVVLSWLLGLPYVLGAFAAGMGCALAIGYLKEHSRVRQETLMGVVFSGMFAFGLVLYVAIETDVHLDHILFGDMLGILPADLWLAGGIGLLVVAAMAWRWRDLLLHAFDPVHAASLGLPVRWLHYGLLAMLSLSIVGALKAVGLVLAIALLITPGAIAYLLTRTFAAMLLVAVLVSLLACLAGVYLSFFLDSAPAPTIVVLMSAMFVVTYLGYGWRMRRARRSAVPGRSAPA
ncbi:MAG: metal ABC transporter permease [Luteimonas sp.]